MEYGIQHNPDNWHLYYDLGFVYYTELKDYKGAAEAFEQGSKVPNASLIEAPGRPDGRARRRLRDRAHVVDGHVRVQQRNPISGRTPLEHLRAIRVDEDVTHLQDAVTRFEQRMDAFPRPSGNWQPPNTCVASRWTRTATPTS